MKKIIKIVVIIVLAIAAAAGAAWYFLTPETLEVVLPEKGNISPVLTGVGKVEGERTITVYSSVPGFIAERLVESGERVTAGEKLLTYQGEEQLNDVQQASTDVDYSEKILDAASGNRAKYQSIYNKSLKEIENCKNVYALLETNILSLDIKNHEKAYIIREQQKACQSDVYKLEAQIADKQSRLAKIEVDIKELEMEDELSEKDYDKLDDWSDDAKDIQDEIRELNYKISDAQRAALCLPQEDMDPETYARYSTLQNNLETVTRMWSEARSDRDTAQSMLTALQEIYADEQTLAQNWNTLRKAEKELDKAQQGCVAPADGIITACHTDAGAYVEKGVPVFEMQSDKGYKVRMMVSKYDITSVKEGQSADIRLGDLSYTGTVTKIDQAAENDAAGKSKAAVEITIDTDDDMIVGLEADITLKLDEAKDVLKVPTECVYTDDEGSFLYVCEEGTVKKKYFDAGVKDGTFTEAGNLPESAQVVTDPEAASLVGEEVAAKVVDYSGAEEE